MKLQKTLATTNDAIPTVAPAIAGDFFSLSPPNADPAKKNPPITNERTISLIMLTLTIASLMVLMYIIGTQTTTIKVKKMQTTTKQADVKFPLAQLIRDFTGDHEKGNIHEVMARNNLPVDYLTAKSRIRDLGWTDIEKILTTPKNKQGTLFADRTDLVIEVLNSKVGEKLRTADLVRATGLLSKHVSESMNAIYEKYNGLQRARTKGGYIFHVVEKLTAKQKASNGNRGIDMKGIKFVKRAQKPDVDTSSIGPNWFITKKLH